jgi:hypothetical protein
MPAKKITKKPAAKKAATVKPAKPIAKPVKKTMPAKTAKAPAKKAVAKKPVKAAAAKDSSKLSIQPKELFEKKAKEKGESIESLIIERNIELKPVEEYLGIQQKQDYRNKPVIEGVFDLLIPPGTPRKLILKLAKEYPIQIVRRDDIYVPVGVCDIERDLLAIRGDKKTIQKMEKILFEEIDAFIEGRDARLHDYSKPIKLEGISVPAAKPKKAQAKK